MRPTWRKAWTSILLLFLALRVVYSSLGAVMASRPDPQPLAEGPIFVAAQTLLKSDRLSHLLVNVWMRWDTGWYLKIAGFGYDPGDGTSAYMPLFPWLLRGLGLLSGNFLLSGLIISNIAALAALILLFETARAEGLDEIRAGHVLASFAFFPTTFFLFAAYTDSLFIALTLGAWLAARKDRWLFAGLLGGLATLCRLQGVLLTPVFAWLWLTTRQGWPDGVRRLFSLFASLEGRSQLRMELRHPSWIGCLFPAITFLAYNLSLTLSGFPTIPQILQSHWGIRTVMPWSGIALFLQRLFAEQRVFVDFVDLSALMVIIAALILGLRRLNPALSLYGWATLSLFFMRGTPPHLLDSFSRYMLAVFPAFLVMGLAENRILRVSVWAVSAVLQVFLLMGFLDWRWIA